MGRVGTYGRKIHVGIPKYPEKVMIWAVVSGDGISFTQYFRNLRLTSQLYIDLCLKPFVEYLREIGIDPKNYCFCHAKDNQLYCNGFS